MKPESWERVAELYRLALERPEGERAAFLQQACAGDDELGREVASLLAQEDKSFLEKPALELVARKLADLRFGGDDLSSTGSPHSRDNGNPALQPGATISHYRILKPLGGGGMGVVYRAHDTRLGRDVALKFLPEAFAKDTERLARFKREAHVLASLNHPNIASIYGLEESGGVLALAMELVEGPTLAGHIESGAIPIEEALPIAQQITEALEYAHERGIIHRDLKPANVKVTSEGTAKVLDFGLAKALDPQDSANNPNLQNSPTLTTELGMILGTPGYMSPEQAKGQRVDRRADIWAFGCVLYEMLAGRKAFAGESMSETLAAVLKTEPDWSALPVATPAPIQRLVRRCLNKDPKQRLQAIGEARITIEETLAGDVATGLPGQAIETGLRHEPGMGSVKPPLLSTWRRALPWGVAALLVIAAAFVIGHRFSRPAPLPAYQQLTFRRGPISAARIAPDGKTIVYAAAWDGHPNELYTALLGSAGWRSLNLPGANLLAISSTGEMALCLNGIIQDHDFYSGTLAQVPLAGGAPREILDNVEWADWSPDGSTLAVVHFVGGERQLEYPIGKVLYRTSGWISHIRISPQGDKIAFLDHPVWPDDMGSVAVVDLNGKKTVLSTGWESEEGLAWSPSGKEVWFTAARAGMGRQLYAVSLDGKQRVVARLPGDFTLEDIFSDGKVLLTRNAERWGIMGLGPGEGKERDLSWLDIPWVTDLSADGKTLLFDEQGEAAGQFDVPCIRKTDGSSPPVMLGKGISEALSPDGKWALSIVFSSPEQLTMLPTSVGSEKILPRGPISHYALDNAAKWFPDGKRILVVGRASGHGYRCYVQDANGGDPKPITPEGIRGWLVSPDGKEVLASDGQGKFWLYPVAGGKPMPVPGLEPKDTPIQWSADGHFLFVTSFGGLSAKVYRFDLANGKRQLWKELAPANRTGLAGVPTVVVTPDGKSYAYDYETMLSDLYLAEGLK